MQRTKILMLGWEFPPVINGGLGIACLGMAKALSKHADLSIILPKSDPDFIVDNVDLIGLNNLSEDDIRAASTTETQYNEFDDVSFVSTGGSILPYSSDDIKTSKILGTKVEGHLNVTEDNVSGLEMFKNEDLYGNDVINKVIQYAKFAARIASKKDFDIIHAHDWMTYLAGVEIKKMTGKPLAVHVHSLSYDRSGPEGRGWVYDVEKYGMEQADLVIPVSFYTGDVIKKNLGIDPGKIYPVHNGADKVEVHREEKGFPDKMVLFLGRVTIQKGPEIFLEIASEVIKQHKHVRFVMAGTGDKLKRVIESGAYKHVGDKFHFTGFLNKEKVNRLLALADVYCMPSVSEPFGLSALEATQYGIPAVISKQSGVAEVLHGALKADYWDVKLMAKYILDLIQDEELCEQVAQAGYEDMKKLSWDDAAEKIMEVFNNYLHK